MAPLQPMHDLIYNDLSTIGDTQLVDPQLASIGAGGIFDPNAATGGVWQFEGDFGNDSFWGFMNNYNPWLESRVYRLLEFERKRYLVMTQR
jgi:hypothetical protein